MFLLNTLRMMGDLAVYYAFAGFFVACVGPTHCLLGLILSALCYGLSAHFNGKRSSRLVCLLPEVLVLLLPWLSKGDRLALLPVMGYTAYLAWKDTYDLTQYRQVDLFSLFCKLYPPFFILLALMGGWNQLLSGSLPYAALAAILSVFLMRVLRHQPETYLQPKFLVWNTLPLAMLVGIAGILSIPAVLNALKAALLAIYNVTIAPLILAAAYALGFLILHTVYPLFQWLMRIFGNADSQVEAETAMDSLTGLTQDSAWNDSASFWQVLKVVGGILVIAIVILLLFWLFRRMAGTRGGSAEGAPAKERRSSLDVTPEIPGQCLPRSPRDPVNQVRRQYRRYLRLCNMRGFSPHACYTSLDIHRGTEKLFPDSAPAAELRELYIQARYHGSAAPADARRARELVEQLKKEKL